MSLRTSVGTNPDDTDERDEWPGCFGTVDETGALQIVNRDEDDTIDTIYLNGEWAFYEVYAK